MKKFLLFFFLSTSLPFHPLFCAEQEIIEKKNVFFNKIDQKSFQLIPGFVSFFETLKNKQSIKSYRFFEIWTAGYFKDYKNDIFIGGSKEIARQWIKNIFIFLSAGVQAFGPKNFMVELILDDPTYKTQQKDLDFLKTKFSDSFKLSFADKVIFDVLENVKESHENTTLEEYVKENDKNAIEVVPSETAKSYWKEKDKKNLESLLLQYKDGNPAVSSDLLRIYWLINKDYDLNCYIDIDNFMGRMESIFESTLSPEENVKHNFRSQLEAKKDYFYIRKNASNGNDYFLVIKPEKVAFEQMNNVQRRLQENIIGKIDYFDHLRERAALLDQGYEVYKQALMKHAQKIMNFAIHIKGQYDVLPGIFSFFKAVMNIAGPSFFDRMIESGKITNAEQKLLTDEDYRKREKFVAGTWYKDQSEKTEYQQFASNPFFRDDLANNLTAINSITTPAEANDIIPYIIMLEMMSIDYDYYLHFLTSDKFDTNKKKEVQSFLIALSADIKKYYKRVENRIKEIKEAYTELLEVHKEEARKKRHLEYMELETKLKLEQENIEKIKEDIAEFKYVSKKIKKIDPLADSTKKKKERDRYTQKLKKYKNKIKNKNLKDLEEKLLKSSQNKINLMQKIDTLPVYSAPKELLEKQSKSLPLSMSNLGTGTSDFAKNFVEKEKNKQSGPI